jgi:stage II sporulation protein AA (anti-sigma F factor antagonist)
MDFATKKENGWTIVSIAGRMDAITTPEVEKKLGGLVESGEKKLVVDLKDLTYVSSAGLRGLLATAKKLKAGQGDIAFANLQGPVRDVFEISGFCSIFKVFDSVAAALA